MKLTVYRQSSKTRPDGTVVYKGEDALPYIDEQIFFVADGLGGAAAIRHQKIKQELFDKNELMRTLFDGVYDDYSDERFVTYVTDSFFELFAVKDCYTDNINNIKKSGYFASRIVTAIVLHELLYNEKCSAKSIFELHKKAIEEDKTDAFLSSLGDHFKKQIQDNLRKVAHNANLIYESSYSGLALLGSTICATIYYEHEDCVEAMYLTAGDSRPYVWDSKRGLCQVLADQEGKDGGMTNYIRANEDADFDIRCNYFKFDKPCVLFNASDGCFDSGKFISQLAFEKLIMDSAKATDSVEGLSEALTSFFVDYGRHDDSSTIAMRFFGFDSFDAFKEKVNERSAVLENDYIAVMPDILDVDYVAEYEQCANTFPAKISALKDKFESEKGTVRYCTEFVRSGKYRPYVEKVQAIDGKIEVQKTKIRAAKNNIENIIAQNFIKFKPFLDCKDSWTERHYTSKIQNVERKYKERATDYLSVIERYKKDFDKSVQSLNNLLGRIFEIGVPETFSDFDDISYQIVEDCEKTMDDLFEFFAGLKSRKLDVVRKLTQQRKDYIEKNIKLAQRYHEAVKTLRQMVEMGRICLDDIQMFSDDRRELLGELDVIKTARAEMDKLGSEAKDEALHEAVDSYWEENYIEIISVIVKDTNIKLSDTVRNEAVTVLNELNEQTKGVKEKCELQRQLFSKYDEVYSMYIGGITE